MSPKYSMPAFLKDVVEPELYERWLDRKAAAHVKRDNGRNHAAVKETPI